MGWLNSLGGQWFQLIETASIVATVLATAFTIRADIRVRKIQNLFAITQAHRELWMEFYRNPRLHRILDPKADLQHGAVSLPEERFVHEIILHLRASFKARQAGMEFDDDAVATDVREFFSLPVPRQVWSRSKVFQDRDFVAFVDACVS